MINLTQAVEDLPITRENEYIDPQWVKHLESLRAHMRTGDPNEFMLWSTVQATMQAEGPTDYIRLCLEDLRLSSSYPYYEKAMIETFPGKYNLVQGTNANRILQMAHLENWAKSANIHNLIRADNILEIGGGYGSMTDCIYRMGFQGNYHLVDLPELILLQKFYLERTLSAEQFVKVKFYEIENGRFPVLPQEVDLLIAIASLSEMPLTLRKALLGMVAFAHVLILYQTTFFGVDNHHYIAEMLETHGGQRFESPYLKSHHYWVK